MMSRLFGEDTKSFGMPGYDYPFGDDIDLREELKNIFYGGPGIKPKAHYVVLRHFDLSKPTEQFDSINKEALGPAPFEYEDQVILSYRARPVLTQYNEQVISPGIINLDTYIYFFEYDVKIAISDFIFEFNMVDGQDIDISNLPVLEEKYNIRMIDPRRADRGRIEFYRVVAELDHGHRI